MSARRLVLWGGIVAVSVGMGCDRLSEMIGGKASADKERAADDEDEEDEDEDDEKTSKKDAKDKKKSKKDDGDEEEDDEEDEEGIRPLATRLTDVSGSYTITNSSNPGGSGSYKGTVSLSRDGDTYSIAWTIANSPPYKGVAIPAGPILGVGWGMGADYGVAVFQVKKDVLDGRWATAVSGAKLGRDTLRRVGAVGASDIDGAYDMEGETPDGKTYRGKATIKRAGDVFHVKFTGDDGRDAITGVGIRDSDILTVGWGTEGKEAGVVSYRADGKELIGRWATPGGSQLGTEELKIAK